MQAYVVCCARVQEKEPENEASYHAHPPPPQRLAKRFAYNSACEHTHMTQLFRDQSGISHQHLITAFLCNYPFPTFNPLSQIPHPKRISHRQRRRVYRPRNQIHDRLIRRQNPIWRSRKTHRLLNHQLAVLHRRIPQCPLRKPLLMLLRKPEDHLIPHEDGQLLLQLAAAFRFREATRDCHDSGREEALSRQRTHEFLEIGC